MHNSEVFQTLVQTLRRLRAPGGCPWDQAQTHQSLRPHLLEETYEVLDLLDQIGTPSDLENPILRKNFQEELGDLWLQILLHAQIAEDSQAFNIFDIAQSLQAKLIRRHPHVFGDQNAPTPEEALKTWNQTKSQEKTSLLDGIPRHFPALQKAARLLDKVKHVGFQVPSRTKDALRLQKHSDLTTLETRFGDLLFQICQEAYQVEINPEQALQCSLKTFEKNFRWIEILLKFQNQAVHETSPDTLQKLWAIAQQQPTQIWGLTGGIACGKSTVGNLLKTKGVAVLDADHIAHTLLRPGGRAYESTLKLFGTTDRRALRTMVFSDPEKKQALEHLLHPLIQEQSAFEIQQLSATYPIIVYEASLLIETGQTQRFDELIVLDTSWEQQKQRLLQREGMSEEIAQRILQSQVTSSVRQSHGSVVFHNSHTLEDLNQHVEAWLYQKALQITLTSP